MTSYGPHNPHPLSQMRTELVWEGKYDEFGNRREVNTAGLAMPLQKIETIDEPRSRAQAQGSLFDEQKAHRDDFRNRLIWGDNKLVMASLLEEFKGAIDLIYIDPPFDVGANFTLSLPIGDGNDKVGKDQSVLEMVAYRDTWGRGAASYVHMMYERLSLMRELLSNDGSIFVHLAPTVSHSLKLLLDEVFGLENFRNEIIVNRPISKNLQRQFNTITSLPQGHDTILWYSKHPSSRFNNLLIPYETKNPEGYWHRFWSGADRPTMRYELLGETPTHGQWKWSKERALRAVRSYERFLGEADGRPLVQFWRDNDKILEFIRKSESGTVENWFAPHEDKIADTVWEDVKSYENRKDFPTQKHVDLLERVIEFRTEEDSLVADFFCGSGTTLVVAEQLGRKWIGADLGRFGVHTSRKRLIELQRDLHSAKSPYRSFDVFNLGRYERQWWQQEALHGAEKEHRAVVLKFFRAETLNHAPSPLIHGRKGAAFVHVDGIDSIFMRDEAAEVAKAVKAAGGREVHCLAWDFEMDIRQAVAAIEAEFDLKMRLHRIPREIMEKNRKEVPPFYEVALLTAEPVVKNGKDGNAVDIKLTNFVPSLTEVPARELEALEERAVESGFDFIDFWAIDFDWAPGRPFNHHWQDYRTRKDRSLKTVSDAEFNFENAGTYTACIKVVDVFGCDTSITLEIKT